MTPVQISPAPQPAGNAKAPSQADNATNSQTADGQATEPFAKVLSRRVDENDAPAPKTDAADSTKSDQTSQTSAATTVPADALAAIMSQIPVEMRGVNIATPLADANGRPAAVIDPALLKKAEALVHADAQTKGNALASSKTEVSVADGLKKPLIDIKSGHDKSFAAALRTENKSITADAEALRQSQLKHADIAANPAQLAASQSSTAATVSQATLAAMTGTAINNPAAGTVQSVPTPLGSPGWGDDFSQKVSWMVSQKNQVAELHLNPPNLGPLDVVLKISDNQATALFTSPHAMVRDAVENALPKLRELLADNGIMLSNATVGDQSPRDRGSEAFSSRETGAITRGGGDIAPTETALPTTTARRHNGVLDTFA